MNLIAIPENDIEWRQEAIKRIAELMAERDSLLGHVRRLEKSNQELGEENHRLKGTGIGWNANT